MGENSLISGSIHEESSRYFWFHALSLFTVPLLFLPLVLEPYANSYSLTAYYYHMLVHLSKWSHRNLKDRFIGQEFKQMKFSWYTHLYIYSK